MRWPTMVLRALNSERMVGDWEVNFWMARDPGTICGYEAIAPVVAAGASLA